jgi:hypothetical protein
MILPVSSIVNISLLKEVLEFKQSLVQQFFEESLDVASLEEGSIINIKA